MHKMNAVIQQKDYLIQLMQEKIKNMQEKQKDYDRLIKISERNDMDKGVSLNISEKNAI